MANLNAQLIYPKQEFTLILQNSNIPNEFFGVDELERKKLRIIQAKFGCRHCFHNLPDSVMLDLNRFEYNMHKSCFEINRSRKVSVRLNELEETIVEYTFSTYAPM